MATTIHSKELLKWFEDPRNKSYFNSELLAIKTSTISTGVGVFAKKTVQPIQPSEPDPEPNLLLRVHKSMILSPQTCSISNLLYDEKIFGTTGLVLSYIYEKQLGIESPWFAYLNSINIKNNDDNFILPLCLWNEKEKNLLKGTEIEVMGGLDDYELKESYLISIDFARTIMENVNIEIPNILDNEGNRDELKFREFAAVTMAIASRAFEIDNFRELALVPGADLFNHESNGKENVHFVTLGEVCEFCGSYEGCGHQEYGPPDSEFESNDEDEDEQEMEEDDDNDDNDGDDEDEDDYEDEKLESITLDFIEKVENELKEEKEKESELKSEDEDVDMDSEFDMEELYLDPDECCDIILENKVLKNQEFFNTYGDLPSAILLVKYGFAIEDNPNDTICLGQEILKYKKESDNKTVEKRLNWWSQVGFNSMKQYIKAQMQKKCADGCCDDDDDDGCGGCKSENESDNDDHHNHHEDGDNDDDDDDDDDDGDEGYSWLYEARLGFPSNFCGYAIAIAKLLTASEEVFESLQHNPQGGFIEEQLVQASDKESNRLLLKWCEDRYQQLSGKELKSGSYKRMLKNSNCHRRNIYIVIMNEKKMLEQAMKQLKK